MLYQQIGAKISLFCQKSALKVAVATVFLTARYVFFAKNPPEEHSEGFEVACYDIISPTQ